MDKKDVKLHLDKNLVNLSNSILKFYDVPTFHPSLKMVDELLKTRKNKKVCVLLLDAFGKVIYEKYKNDCPFLYSHIYTNFYSIYPPTTVAATNAFLTAKYPNENGFVGWNQYFKDVDTYIDVFINKDPINDKKLDLNVINDFLKPAFITDLINKKHGKEIATKISSFDKKDEDKHDDFDYFFSKINEELKTKEFIYAYSTEPDHSMHEYGIINEKIKEKIIYLDKKIKELVEANPETLFIVIADHGFIDIKHLKVFEDKELLACLSSRDQKQIFTIEPRFASFNVINETKFKEIYNARYKDKYLLFTKKELLNSPILGEVIKEKEININTLNTLGNYFLISFSDSMLVNKNGPDFDMKGTHAGCSLDEMELNLLVFNK